MTKDFQRQHQAMLPTNELFAPTRDSLRVRRFFPTREAFGNAARPCKRPLLVASHVTARLAQRHWESAYALRNQLSGFKLSQLCWFPRDLDQMLLPLRSGSFELLAIQPWVKIRARGAPTLSRYKIRFQLKLSTGIPTVSQSDTQLHQIAVALASTALKKHFVVACSTLR